MKIYVIYHIEEYGRAIAISDNKKELENFILNEIDKPNRYLFYIEELELNHNQITEL